MTLTTKIAEPAPEAPAPLGPVELARWVWRQLTSMRTALLLLFNIKPCWKSCHMPL
jgi:cytochrome c biogenesis protein